MYECEHLEDLSMATITTTVSSPSRAWRIGQRILRGVGRVFGALFALVCYQLHNRDERARRLGSPAGS